jgi:error-prone DNA polymerase
VVVMPDVFERQRMDIVSHAWLVVEGKIQNVDNVVHVLAQRVTPLSGAVAAVASHDFH